VCRTEVKGKEMLRRLYFNVPNKKANFEVMIADLTDLDAVKALADEINGRGKAVDILVNNAAVARFPRYEESKQGFELQMATNHLAHFALTGALLPSLRSAEEPRVVNVTSLKSWKSRLGRNIDFTAPGKGRSYNPERVYARTKLANLVFTRELAKRYPELTVAAAHTGPCTSELQRHAKQAALIKMFWQYTGEGAVNVLRAATDCDIKPGTCHYYGPLVAVRGPPVRAVYPLQARWPSVGTDLWAKSVAATGVDY
jgi:NAD(P)-dependent dehydrogenase (short-subunit alcohol dehydrogenase family)